MKKILSILSALFMSCFSFAQNGEIIYTDFGQGISVCYEHGLSNPSINLDLDQDGTYDCRFYYDYEGWGHWIFAYFSTPLSTWSYRLPYEFYYRYQPLPIEGDSIQIGDTIANIADYWYHNHYRFTYPDYPFTTNDPSHWVGSPEEHYYISVRNQTEDGYCYGWIDANLRFYLEQYGGFQIYVTVFRTAYCTIPDYPLCVGQMDFTWNVEGTEATAFATLHPNPTIGTFTVTGKALRQAEVVNTLGQRIITVTGEGDALQIDLQNQPAGIYFVNVTDAEGRRCVKKVVKE